MPVSGLVVSLSNDDESRSQAIAAINQEPRNEVGVIEANRMAVVIDSPSAAEDKELWAWLNGLAGVVFVDLVMVGFEEDAASREPAVNEQQTRWESTPAIGRGV